MHCENKRKVAYLIHLNLRAIFTSSDQSRSIVSLYAMLQLLTAEKNLYIFSFLSEITSGTLSAIPSKITAAIFPGILPAIYPGFPPKNFQCLMVVLNDFLRNILQDFVH